MCVCIFLCLCVSVCGCTCVSVCASVYFCVRVWMYACVSVDVSVCVFVCAYVRVCISVCVCVFVCGCLYLKCSVPRCFNVLFISSKYSRIFCETRWTVIGVCLSLIYIHMVGLSLYREYLLRLFTFVHV